MAGTWMQQIAMGWLAHGIGIRPTLFLCGALTIVVGLVHSARLKRRTAAEQT